MIARPAPAAIFLLLSLLFFSHVYAATPFVILPTGRGPFNITLKISELVDTNRPDPFNSSHVRRLMVSRFDPVWPLNCKDIQLVSYFPFVVAAFEDKFLASNGFPTGVSQGLQLQSCAVNLQAANISDPFKQYPLVLFSPGLGTSRLVYSLLAQEVASYGYTVVTVDHPYDSDIVEFPDGTVIYGGLVESPNSPNDTASVERGVEIRAADISFVLDSFKADKALMFGHSFGGAAAATAMLHDARIAGGVDLDGAIWGSILTAGLHHPSSPGQSFLLFGREGHNSSAASDLTWNQFWATISAESKDDITFKRELSLKNASHSTWIDLNLLVDVLGIRGNLTEQAQQLVSPVKGERAYKITTAYLTAFFRVVLTGKKEAILEKDSSKYPEVKIIQ